MPPGAISGRENRFALLAEDSPPKKQKLNNKTNFIIFPELPSTAVQDPKYITISSLENNKTLSDFSCFLVYKAIQIVSKEIVSISDLRDGNLLLLVKDKKIANKFLTITHLHNIGKVECKMHAGLNTTKGTIYAPYLNKVDENEIVNELKNQGVSSVYKFTKKNAEGKQIPSGVLLLSFDSYHLPSKIDVCWHSVKVKEYLPNPMRCKSCQLLGHTSKRCKNTPTCVNCNLPPHSPIECTRVMCANCFESHPSSSNECKKYKQMKEILAIKTKNKCTWGKAKQIFNNLAAPETINPSTSYASVLSQSNVTHKPTTKSSNTTNESNLNNNLEIVKNTNKSPNTNIVSNINNSLEHVKNTCKTNTDNNTSTTNTNHALDIEMSNTNYSSATTAYYNNNSKTKLLSHSPETNNSNSINKNNTNIQSNTSESYDSATTDKPCSISTKQVSLKNSTTTESPLDFEMTEYECSVILNKQAPVNNSTEACVPESHPYNLRSSLK